MGEVEAAAVPAVSATLHHARLHLWKEGGGQSPRNRSDQRLEPEFLTGKKTRQRSEKGEVMPDWLIDIESSPFP